MPSALPPSWPWGPSQCRIHQGKDSQNIQQFGGLGKALCFAALPHQRGLVTPLALWSGETPHHHLCAWRKSLAGRGSLRLMAHPSSASSSCETLESCLPPLSLSCVLWEAPSWPASGSCAACRRASTQPGGQVEAETPGLPLRGGARPHPRSRASQGVQGPSIPGRRSHVPLDP